MNFKNPLAGTFVVVLSVVFAMLFFLNTASAQEHSETSEIAGLKVWPSQPPAGIPFAPSTELTGIAFTGRHAQYGHADTWYPSWAANGNLYSPWTDGEVNGVKSNSCTAKAYGEPSDGNHWISPRFYGDDPMH